MIEINKVVTAPSQAGDGTTLQPAAPLSPQVKAKLFDEFMPHDLPQTEGVGSPIILLALLTAAILAGGALYVVKHIKKDPLAKSPADY